MIYTAYDIPNEDNEVGREMRRRITQWAIYNYKPTERPMNDQLGFHESQALVRMIIGSNRSGKTQSPCAEVAALGIGPPYPWWFNWKNPPAPPCSIWIVVPYFNENPANDARLKKLYLGEEGADKDGNRIIRPPLIPPEMIAWHSADYYSVRLKNNTSIDFKASSQQSIQLASANVDLIFIDEPTRQTHWDESLARLLALPGSRLIHCCTDTTIRTRYLDRVLAMRDKVPVFTFTTEGNPYKSKVHSDEVMSLMDDEAIEVRIKGRRLTDLLLCYPNVFHWVDERGMPIIHNGRSSNWIPAFRPPAHWTRYAIHDPGKTNPSAVVWLAVEPNGDIHAYKMRYWRKPPWSTKRLMSDIMTTNDGDRVVAWYMDPKAAKQPQLTTEDYYVRGKRTIDLYREVSDQYGVFWRLGSPKLEGMARIDRLGYTHAYMDPLDNSHPMLWIHDTADMQPLREEFLRYRIEIAKQEGKNNPETTHEADNHAIYCVEGACIMRLGYEQPGSNILDMYGIQSDINEMMLNSVPEGYFGGDVRA